MCPAPKGNQFWKLQSKHGRDKLFSSPELLWEAACEYFQWCDEHPWLKKEVAKAGDHFGETVSVDIPRPYTIHGLCIYLDCDENTISRYAQDDNYKAFWVITRKIKRIIYNQKFEGAAVGAFNPVIISRDLGLTEKQNIDHTTGGKPLPITGVKIIKDGDNKQASAETD